MFSLLQTYGKTFDEESLPTVMVETEGILNSRSLIVEMISDSTSELPLSPANILTMKSKLVLPPPGEFSKPELYCRKRWRRIQHVINVFVALEKRVSSALPRKKEVARQKAKFSKW